MLNNKLGITNGIELAKEERLTKIKALELFDKDKISEFEIGTFNGLAKIHEYLFSEIYDFAGKLRKENIAHPFRECNGRSVYMKGIDVSYQYEGYTAYSMQELDE